MGNWDFFLYRVLFGAISHLWSLKESLVSTGSQVLIGLLQIPLLKWVVHYLTAVTLETGNETVWKTKYTHHLSWNCRTWKSSYYWWCKWSVSGQVSLLRTFNHQFSLMEHSNCLAELKSPSLGLRISPIPEFTPSSGLEIPPTPTLQAPSWKDLPYQRKAI